MVQALLYICLGKHGVDGVTVNKAEIENNSRGANCTSKMSDNFRRWMPKNVRGAFKVLLCSLLLVNTIILSACGNRRVQDPPTVYAKVANERHRLESLLVGGKQEIQTVQTEMAIAKDMDHLLLEGHQYNPIMIEDVITYDPVTTVHPKDKLKSIEDNYPFMVARMGLDRAVQALMQWVAVKKESTLRGELNRQVPLNYELEVTDPLTGQDSNYINPWIIISRKYPALKDRIEQMDHNLPNIPLKQIRGTMVESLLAVGPQIAEVQFAINNKVAEIHKSMKNTEIFMQEYQELFLERKAILGDEYLGYEIDMKVYLAEDQDYEANNVAGKMNVIYRQLSEKEKSRLQVIEAELERLEEKKVDPSKKELEKLKEELMAHQMLISKMLNAEPILMALTMTNEYTNDEGVTKEVPLYLILHKMIRDSKGALDERLKDAAGYVESFLKANEFKMRQRVAKSIALLASGDRKYLAPLTATRQTTLAFLEHRYPGLAKEEAFKSVDNEISEEFGFDIYGERFADFTFGGELGMILLTSLATGLYSNEIRHMKPYKNTVVNWMKSSPGKQGFIPAVRNRMGNSLKKTIGAISEYEAYRTKVFDNNVTFKKRMERKWQKGQLDQIKLMRSYKHPIKKIKNYSRLLGKATFRMFPSGLLYGSIADVALMTYFANQNKQYFIDSKYIIQDAVYSGVLPYTNGIFAHQEPEGMLPMRLVFMTVSALVLNYYFAWNAGFSFTKAVMKYKKTKGLMQLKGVTKLDKGKSLNEAAIWLYARSIKNSTVGVFKAAGKAFENTESVGKGIFNALSSGMLVTFGEMMLRGYDDKLIPWDDFFTIDYWSRVIAMYTEEGSLAFLNLLSFMVIDFILIFAFDNSKLMSNSKMKIYMAGFLGVFVAMWVEKLIKNQDMTTLDHMRLIFEGSYLATVSTYKYAFLFGPLYDGLQRGYYKMGWLVPNSQMTFGKSTLWLITKSVFFMTNNLAGNLPFQFIIHMEENSDVGPLEAQSDLHTRGVQVIQQAQENLSLSGDIELSEKEIGYIQQNMSGFNDRLHEWLQGRYKEKCTAGENDLEIFGPYSDMMGTVCPQN